MKALKIILGSVYPILILLLLLSNCRGCRNVGANEAKDSDTLSVVDPDSSVTILPNDSAAHKAQQIGQSGNLKVTLLWSFQGDIDLFVKQPNGKTIFFRDKRDSTTGGFLDVDNRNGGEGSAENIFWENPPKGVYRVSLLYYGPSQSSNKAESGTCKVVVFREGSAPLTYAVEMNSVNDQKIIVTFRID